MRAAVTDRSFAPSTLGLRELDMTAGNRQQGEVIRKAIHSHGAGTDGPMESSFPHVIQEF